MQGRGPSMTLKPQSRAHGEGQGYQCREYRTGARLVRFFILIFFKSKVTLWKHRDLEAERHRLPASGKWHQQA